MEAMVHLVGWSTYIYILRWWFSIAMLVYQRIHLIDFECFMIQIYICTASNISFLNVKRHCVEHTSSAAICWLSINHIHKSGFLHICLSLLGMEKPLLAYYIIIHIWNHKQLFPMGDVPVCMVARSCRIQVFCRVQVTTNQKKQRLWCSPIAAQIDRFTLW